MVQRVTLHPHSHKVVITPKEEIIGYVSETTHLHDHRLKKEQEPDLYEW